MNQSVNVITQTFPLQIAVEDLARDLNLKVVYKGRSVVNVTTTNVARPGLQLAGFYQHFDNKRFQIIGKAEHEFIKTIPEKARKNCLEELFKREIPCLIISRNLPVFEEIENFAQKYNCPIFSSDDVTTNLISKLMGYLSQLLAPTARMHGVLLDIFGVGVLITGNAGIGKSETALDLISKGHRLIADDSVTIKSINGELIGSSPENVKYFMEVRGLGIINVKTMYGSGAIRPEQGINIVAELVPWDKGQNYERLGNEKSLVDILGISVQKIQIPVSPGRNIPIVIETAAKKYRLEETGYNAVDELLDRAFNK